MKFKVVLLAALFGLLSAELAAQNLGKRDFYKKVDSINQWLTIYDTLSPFSHRDHYQWIDEYNVRISKGLQLVLNDARTLEVDLDSLFDPEKIHVTRSPDRKIYIFSIDEKTGGTYRPQISIVHCRLPNGKVKAEYFGEHFYGRIFTLDAEKQEYVVVAGLNTCATCISQIAVVLKLDSTSCRSEVILEYEGRYHNLEALYFDGEDMRLTYMYSSPENEDSLYGDNLPEEQGPFYQYMHSLQMVYMNGEFIETESCEYLVQSQE